MLWNVCLLHEVILQRQIGSPLEIMQTVESIETTELFENQQYCLGYFDANSSLVAKICDLIN